MITKKNFKAKPEITKVTFKVTSEELDGSKKVALAGDFNDWNLTTNVLKKDKTGDYKVTVELEKGKAYEFKYVKDGENWFNDASADSYTELNSVVTV